MKFKHLILLSGLAVFSFVGCKNDKKKDNMDSKDNMEMKDSTMQKSKDMKSNAGKADTMKLSEMNLAQAAMNSKQLTSFVSAVKSAGMVTQIESKGPFTVFAPTNDAFSDLPNGTVEDLMKPENKKKLEAILSYHIVPGNLNSDKIRDLIKKNDGSYTLVTANDGKLKATVNDAGNIVLIDGRGKKSTIVGSDMKASNGYIHAVNSVLMR